MIKTVEPVSYDPINLTKKDIVFAQVIAALRNDITETYTLHIREFIEVPYIEIINDENGVPVEHSFTTTEVVRNHQRVMTFIEADNLTNYLDTIFTIPEQGSARRKRYTILGHLLINNQEQVRNTEWQLCG